MKRIRYLNFWIFLACLILGVIIFSAFLGPARGVLAGFNIAAMIFIAGTLQLMHGQQPEDMRKRARENDPDRHILLIVALLIIAIILVAVTVEMTGSGGHAKFAIALAGCTLLLAWIFSNLIFALHYAHEFYSSTQPGDEDGRGDGNDGDSGGLQFPGDEAPLYSDFAYFSFVLGMTFQVSDVEITRRSLRRLALYHALVAFLFNIIVVALSVSVIGDILKK